MKKLFLSLVAGMMATSTVFAQGSLLATLSHDGKISAYYGANALKEAVAAAESGDVLTLSSGQFNAVNITKPITLRGAGMSISTDSVGAHEATVVQNAFEVNIADSLSGRVLMEGIYFKNGITYKGTIKNAQFMKCRFLKFIAGTNAKMVNSSFIHCRFYDGFTLNNNSSNAYFINSLVCSPINMNATSNIEFDNCFVKFDYSSSYGSGCNSVYNAYYKNCIIQEYTSYDSDSYPYSYPIPSSCTAYNCVGFNGQSSYNMFKYISSNNKTNTFLGNSFSTLFKSYNKNASSTFIQDIDDFTLTNEAATKYLGTDGTQVGIYGGTLTYDENPTIPQITKCNVASKSTADGKLSVDIEVRAAEY